MLIDLDYSTFEIPDTDAKIQVKSLSVEAYQKILGVMAKMETTGDDVQSGLVQLSNPEVLLVAKEILPGFTKDLTGIQIKENGKTVDATTDDLLKHGAFLQMCFTIIMHLFTISGVKQEDVKKVKK